MAIVTSIDQVNIGMCLRLMPGARIRRMVTRKLMLPMVMEAISISRPAAVTLRPKKGAYRIEVRGEYRVQPVSAAPPAKKLINMRIPEKR
jgi:hypothetical protein